MPNMSASFDYLRYIVRYTEIRCSARYILLFCKSLNLLGNIRGELSSARPRESGTQLAPPPPLRRRLLHECVGVGRRHVDLGAADVGIECLEHGVGGVGGFAGKAAVAGIHRQA